MFLDKLVDALLHLVIRLALGFGSLDDKSLGYLAGSQIGNLDDCAIRDKGVAEKVSFELCRSNLVALCGVSK